MTRRVQWHASGEYGWIDRYDEQRDIGPDGKTVDEMMSPARCGCGQVYDLGSVNVTARYADCSMWTTPCCHRLTDSRPKGWCEGPGYTELRR